MARRPSKKKRDKMLAALANDPNDMLFVGRLVPMQRDSYQSNAAHSETMALLEAVEALLSEDPPRRGDGRMLLHDLELHAQLLRVALEEPQS